MATILVVDDQPANRKLLVILLGQKGHRMLEAANGAAALESVRAEHPDLVITDILMPTMDGYEFLRQLRADPAIAATPVIVFTGQYQPEELNLLPGDLGLVHHLSKPADPAAILRTVDRVLEAKPLPPAPPFAEEFDRQYLRVLNDKLARKVAQLQEEMDQRLQAEEDRARRLAQLQALAQASLTIAATFGLETRLRDITEQARAIIGAHQSVTSLTIDANLAQTINTVSLSDKYAAWRGYDVHPDGSGIYALVCRHNRPLRLTQAELEAHPAWRGFGPERDRHPPMRGWLAVPLVGRDGRNLGLIQLSDKAEGEFDATDEAILTQLAQLASSAIENAQLFEEVRTSSDRLQFLSRRLLEAQETERRHIARELHDQVGQALTAVKLNLHALLHSAKQTPLAARLQDSMDLMDRVIQQVRNLSLDLRPSVLDDLGLVAALRWYLDRQTQRAGLVYQFTAGAQELRLPTEVETACFRVTQEALTNILRHARAKMVRVELRQQGDDLHLVIADDGVGFDVAAAEQRAVQGGSLGLLGMHERVTLLGGRIELVSTANQGTQVRVCFPVPPAAESTGQGMCSHEADPRLAGG